MSLALSIGASTALFSVVDEAVFAEPPYPEPDRLVVVDMLFGLPDTEMNSSQWSYPRYRALQEEVSTVTDLSGYGSRSMTLTELGAPAVLTVEVATPSLFPLLGVTASRGRVFGVQEEDRGAPRMVALVSDAFWQTRMGASPDAIGTIVTLDGLHFEVIGVVGDRYTGLSGDADVWIPFAALREVVEPSMLEDAWNQHFHVVGRLGAGVTLEGARSEVRAFGETVMERFPAPVGAERLISGGDVVSFQEARENPAAATSMLALFGAVILVLLIATANLAGLLLARGASRQREAAVRASLGAGRGRIVRQSLTESLTLAVIGGLLGVGLASVGIDVLGAWLAESLGTGGARGLEYLDVESLSIDWRVLLFATALTGGVGLAFGFLPAWQTARTDPNVWLKGGGTMTSPASGLFGMNSRNVLIAGQIALAITLLSSASLMMRTSLGLQRIDLGFDRAGMLTALYSLSPADEQAGIDPGVFHSDVVERLRSMPGVVSATVGEVPMGGPTWRTIVLGSEGRPELTPAEHLWLRMQPVSDGYVGAMGATLLEGRDIESTDDWNTERVIVLGRSASEELFPDGSPLGQKVRLSRSGYGGEGATVVGVVEDIRLDRPGTPPERFALVPVRQAPQLESGLMIRAAGDPEALIGSLRSEMAILAPNVALTSVMSMERRVASVTERSRVLTFLLGFFGSVALFLVAVGLYGAIAWSVTRRTPELGLRASLGAGRMALVSLVLRQSLGTTIVGILVGGLGSVAATRLFRSLLFEARSVDLVGFTGVTTILLVVALLAAWIPARRGMRVDPVVALRSE